MSDVEEVVKLIKDCWPHFNITKENLLHPTPELVVKFYTCFINDYNDTVQYLTGFPVLNVIISTDLEPEESLFQQLCKLEIQSLKFTLSDFYSPTPLRTKNFFRVYVHFIAFIQNVLNETDIIENEVIKTKEETTKLLIEQEELLNEINENAVNKELNERNKSLLEQEYKSTKIAYKKMRELKASKDKLCAEKKLQIETLKWEMQNEEYELKCLEAIEKDLLQQRLTEREYHNILQTVETLKAESEMLDNDDVNIGDGLVHENKVLLHSADCLGILNQLDFDVQNVKDLINKKEELKAISTTLEKLDVNKLHFLKQQKPDGEKKRLLLQGSFLSLQNQHKDIRERYTNSINQFSQEIVRFKDKMEEACQNNSKAVLKYKEDIKKLEEDTEKLKKEFTNEYVRVSKIECRVVDNFRDMLMKYSNLS